MYDLAWKSFVPLELFNVELSLEVEYLARTELQGGGDCRLTQ